MSDLRDAAPPPIPQRTRHLHVHRHRDHGTTTPPPPGTTSSSNNNNHTAASDTYVRRRSLQGPAQPASPEVISSLITSLSVISKPADRHFESPTLTSLSLPSSPRHGSLVSNGSFGVDYGAFSQPSLGDLREETVSLDELAASSPVIRTAKPPSGFSPLTAPKSPSRDSSGGFKSILRNSSRPSSRSSLGSRDDTQSIGNLSVERGVAPASDSTRSRSRSRDSWGRKQGRSHKGLMYMSSKERLREKEYERKRLSGAAPASRASFDDTPLSTGLSPRPDPFLAETPISEEPPIHYDPPTREPPPRPDHAPTMDPLPSPRPIPTRDSSLRKTGPNAKRSSVRNSRSKRDGESSAIPEDDEARNSNRYLKDQSWYNEDGESSKKSADLGRSSQRSSANMTATGNSRADEIRVTSPQPQDDLEDGAPFPAVAQGRRRDEHSTDRSRRKSGRQTPDANEAVRLKRSSSRLKRLSAPLSPRSEGGSGRSDIASPEPVNAMPSGYERPRSADSVDDAVESYLCSPRLSQKIRHPQTGRVISFSEVGDSEGSAVFCCVGMGLTRYITAFYDELALTLKLRLITPDRPGVGDSEAYADGTATPLSWPDDVYAICQALKITKFSILAHSAGAIYALATALRMPQHIRGRIHLLAPWIPPSQMNVFGTSQTLPPTNAIPTSQRILRALPTPFLKAANSSFMSATSSSITSSLPKNSNRRSKRKSTNTTGRDTPAARRRYHAEHGQGKPRPDRLWQGRHRHGIFIGTREHGPSTRTAFGLTHAIWDLATTGANPAVDLLVCLERRHTIGFRYVDITRPVVIHHGSRDTRVPVDNVKWLGKTMRRCEVRVLEGEGHGLMASAGVMGSVLMEISKEWDDWMKVTGNGGKKEERGRRGTLGRS
ncbi:hydrolase [Verticillium alfalfae VaMs.102]|uniref:Hydrolase n=1 Tax=Verticillium alfalfae (strain VaMs.102 / ATCC MYA-4576 / FGSC 10136) TaxID=526221 RepID=C9S8F2_VERA1|nr:hydrolase [Verticillium alfalfae VaMs.102]EEY15342.1 hydrolase [Verticillium alfalfae VaMs.102]